jgi:quinoprotein glucose dehydrogenase
MNNESKANISKGPSRDTSPPVIAWLTILFALLAGLYLLTGGIWLVMMGGSPYYIVAGIVLLAVAWLIYRGNGLALSLYALLLIGTLIWAVFEAGFDFWALAPRTDILVLFGIWLLLPFVFRLFDVSARRGGAVALLVCLVLTGVALAYAAFNDPQEINGRVAGATRRACRRLDGVRPHAGGHPLFAAHADQPGQREGLAGRVDLPDGRQERPQRSR